MLKYRTEINDVQLHGRDHEQPQELSSLASHTQVALTVLLLEDSR